MPFTVAEYFPSPSHTGFTDDRQHAVALAYVIPVTGECSPRQDALELTWMTPQEVMSSDVQLEFSGGRGALIRQALAFAESATSRLPWDRRRPGTLGRSPASPTSRTRFCRLLGGLQENFKDSR